MNFITLKAEYSRHPHCGSMIGLLFICLFKYFMLFAQKNLVVWFEEVIMSIFSLPTVLCTEAIMGNNCKLSKQLLFIYLVVYFFQIGSGGF